MATIATVRDALETAVLAGTSATLALRKPLSKDARIPAGATYLRILAVAIGRDGDSNESRLVGQYAVTMTHYLADSLNENAYLVGDAATDQAVLMVEPFWRALAGVHHVFETPELTLPERPRPGNVVEYTVTTQLSIVS